VSTPSQDPGQYLDSQVLVLRSPAVAERAARIANATLRRDAVDPDDFRGPDATLDITPPQGANPGTFGAAIVDVAFTARDPAVAQAGVNAVLQAFDDVRAATIRAQGDATVAGIDRAIAMTSGSGQRGDLLSRRATALANQQIDVAHHPTQVRAGLPRAPVNGNTRRAAALGLVLGLLAGAALAYARAVHRPRFADRLAPATLYGAPLLGDVPHRDRVPDTFRSTARLLERTLTGRGERRSLAVVTPSAQDGGVVGELARALAEGGTNVLAVDAGDGRLTAQLLAGEHPDVGVEQVLAGERTLEEGLRRSAGPAAVSVLPAGGAEPEVRGAARARAAATLLADASRRFDVVLVDSPGVLASPEASELLGAADGALVVVGAGDPVPEHLALAGRLDLLGSDVVGYVYDPGGAPPAAAVR
jgi:Mrp family chromosome partitioning ATPase